MIFFNRHLAIFRLSQSEWGRLLSILKNATTSKYQGLFLAQTVPFTYSITYAGELRDIKMLGQGGLKSCLS
jgi:superfamily II helicase